MTAERAIPALTRPAGLKRRLRKHLASLGFEKAEDGTLVLPGAGKNVVRALHADQRLKRLTKSQAFVAARLPKLIGYFAAGEEIKPSRVKPVLQRISSETRESDLFRLASLTWAVPVSNGFGRRLRYLVWDESNGKLIGIIAVGDPVFNLSVRDKLIGWDVHGRGKRLVHMLDAYVVGALPPYNALLGGKLVASLLRTREVYHDFASVYGDTKGIISGQEKRARLLALTTSSSMGRSSLYNRLRLGDVKYFRSIGYTGGWGHFHIPDDLFADLRAFLREINHSYADMHRFGEGPNWRLRTTRAALKELGLKEDMLRHGIQREVFLCELASNALELLREGRGEPDLGSLLPARDVAGLAVNRWIIPRSERRPEYRAWRPDGIAELLAVDPPHAPRQTFIAM